MNDRKDLIENICWAQIDGLPLAAPQVTHTKSFLSIPDLIEAEQQHVNIENPRDPDRFKAELWSFLLCSFQV